MAAGLSAQEKKGRRGGFGFGFGGRGNVVTLAGNEAVQRELGIGDDVKGKIEELTGKYRDESREAFGDFRNATAEERQKAAEAGRKISAKYAAQIKELIKPDQFTRLQQISWQASGSDAFTEADVIAKLSLTKEQQDKIAQINRDYQSKQRELFTGGGGQESFAKMRELGQQRDKQAEEVLTKEQQTKFAELKGKAFDLTQLAPRRGNN
jgi:Spy/CpxP family protein refolding chaperone